LRHKYPALRTGSYEILYAEGTVYVFARILGAEEIIVAINVGTASADNISFEVNTLQSQTQKLLYGSADFSWSQEGGINQLTFNLPARSGCILG